MMVGIRISPFKHSYSNFGGATCALISMGFFPYSKKKSTGFLLRGSNVASVKRRDILGFFDMTALVQVDCLQVFDIYPPATVGLSLPSLECHPVQPCLANSTHGAAIANGILKIDRNVA